MSTVTCIRKFCRADTRPLAELFFKSVRYGTNNAYTRQQIEAWAPEIPHQEAWYESLSAQIVYVAEDDKGLAGFMTHDDQGYIDLAFVRPDCIGSGVGSQLYRHIECSARERNIALLSTHASDIARPFFARKGWTLVQTKTIDRSGVKLTKHAMEKPLL